MLGQTLVTESSEDIVRLNGWGDVRFGSFFSNGLRGGVAVRVDPLERDLRSSEEVG